jgi:hypothetical protein
VEIAATMRRALSRKYFCSSIDGRGSVTRPSALYAPGDHMK